MEIPPVENSLYNLGCPPSQRGKWSFSSGSPTKNVNILVIYYHWEGWQPNKNQ